MRLLFRIMLVIVGLGVMSCSDILIKDLEDTQVEIVTPAHIDTTSAAAINFWWKEVDEATGYRLQIVSPNYDNVVNLELDTTISDLSTTVSTLGPGDYEWTLRAVNSVSETENPTIHQLYVDEATDISSVKIILNSPINEVQLAQPNIKFRWTGHNGVDEYTLQLSRVSPDQIILDTTLDVSANANPANGKLDVSLPYYEIRDYRWTVSGENLTSGTVTQETGYGYFSIDTTDTD